MLMLEKKRVVMHLTQEVTRITGAQGRLDNRRSRFDRRPSPHPLSPPSWGRCPLYTGCPPCPPSICPLSQGPYLLSCLTPDPGSLGQGLGRGRKWPGPARNVEPLCPARHLPCGTGWVSGARTEGAWEWRCSSAFDGHCDEREM